MDCCEAVKAVLHDGGWECSLKRLDSFTGKEGIVLRRVMPSTNERYMDRASTVRCIVHIVVRKRSEKDAMETCDAIADYLRDRYIPSLDGSYRWTSTEIYTEPQEMALDEDLFYAWNTRVELIVERG